MEFKIKAKFIGQNGFLGYENGKEYFLTISGNITIKRTDGSGVCEYKNIEYFFKNWQV